MWSITLPKIANHNISEENKTNSYPTGGLLQYAVVMSYYSFQK